MRKQLKLLLLVATVVALFAMAMIVGSAATTEVSTADDFMNAVENATAGDIIKLRADITVTDSIPTITQELTIDGAKTTDVNGKVIATHTITSTISTGAMFDVAEAAGKFTIKNVTLVADGLVAPTKDDDNYLFMINGAVEFKAENVTSTLKCFLFQLADTNSDNVGGAKIDFVDSILNYTGTYQIIRYSHKANPNYIKFDGCTINSTSTQEGLIKAEDSTVTLHSCKVTHGHNIFLSDSNGDTGAAHYIISGENTKIQVPSIANLKNASCQYTVTFGEEGKTYKMDIECSNYFLYLQQNGTLTIHGGTYTCTGGTYGFRVSAKVSVSIKNAKIITNGGNLFNRGGASTTVEKCTIEFEGGSNAFLAAASAVTYKDSTIVITDGVPTVTLLSDGEILDNTVILAPAGTVVNSSLTFTGFEMDVKYAGKAYKIWEKFAGNITNTETGAQIYVDTANVSTSGLRFNTKLDGGAIATLVGHGFTATTLLDTVGGYTLKFYTLIAPMDYVHEAGAFTKDALGELSVSGAKYADILANTTLNRDTYATDGYISYAGALINLQSYERVYAAVAMIEVWNGNAVEATYYAGFDSSLNARTAQQVAVAVQGDEWTTAQKAIVDAYAAGDAAQ